MIPWTFLTFLLGLLSLDITAVGQFMVSRPMVVGPLVGLILGQPGVGLAVGALVELIWIGDLPVGAHLPLDTTLLSGVATVLAVETVGRGADAGVATTFALCVVIPMATLSSRAENLVRRINVKLVRKAQTHVEAGRLDTFEWAEALILLVLFAKGILVAGLSLALAHVWLFVYPMLPPEVIQGLSYAPWLLMITGCAAAINLLVEPRRVLLLGVSAAVSVILILFFETPALYLLSTAIFIGLFASLGPLRKVGGPA